MYSGCEWALEAMVGATCRRVTTDACGPVLVGPRSVWLLVCMCVCLCSSCWWFPYLCSVSMSFCAPRRLTWSRTGPLDALSTWRNSARLRDGRLLQ